MTQSFLLCIALWGMLDAPAPDLRFKTSINPDHAFSLEDGRMIFIREKDLLVYDDTGRLSESHTLPVAPPTERVFVGPHNSIWFHDGTATLFCLDDGFEVAWQRRLEPPSAEPRVWNEFLVYVIDRRVLLLDRHSDGTRHSLERAKRVSGVHTTPTGVMIAEDNGDVLRWNPVRALKSWVLKDRAKRIESFSLGPLGAIAAVNDAGELQVIGPGGKPSWQRSFGIEIPVDPVWLCKGKKARVVIATKGRNLLAFGWRGKEHARRLIHSWPKALLSINNDVCLMVSNHGNQLVWYHLERGFSVEKTDQYQALVHASPSYVLLVDAAGDVRRYRRQPVNHRGRR